MVSSPTKIVTYTTDAGHTALQKACTEHDVDITTARRFLVHAGCFWHETEDRTLLIEWGAPTETSDVRAYYWRGRGIRGAMCNLLGKPVICVI